MLRETHPVAVGVSPKRRGWQGRPRQSRAWGEHLGANKLRHFLHPKIPTPSFGTSGFTGRGCCNRDLAFCAHARARKKGGAAPAGGSPAWEGETSARRWVLVHPRPPQKIQKLALLCLFLWYWGFDGLPCASELYPAGFSLGAAAAGWEWVVGTLAQVPWRGRGRSALGKTPAKTEN